MKKNLVMGSVLLAASSLIYAQEVKAEDLQQIEQSPSIEFSTAVEEAKAEGIIVVQEQAKTVYTQVAADKLYQEQTKQIQEVRKQFQLDQENYEKDLLAYEQSLRE